MDFQKISIILLVIPLIFFSCEKEEPEITGPTTEVEVLNNWIWMVMNDVYLWENEIDQSLYPTDQTDPESFFYSLLSEADRFSWIVDDYQELINSFNNVELSTGMSPYFIRIGDSNEVIAIIEYVSKGSPADSAGIIRGDIITDINGETLDTDNYADLFYSENVTLGFANLIDDSLVPNDREVTIAARVIQQNPVVYSELIDFQNHKIGYIVYTGFSLGENNKWQDSIDNLLMDFQNSGVTDLIFDIRYNPGGRVSVANHIAASIAPSDISSNEEIFVKYQWNDYYNNYFLEEQGDTSKNLVVLFEKDPEVKLNLNNVYFLTSPHSASASELIIIGLDPYMNVTQIGEDTYGKSYGSITIPDTEDPARHSWAMQPIVFQFANADGFTGFSDGIEPDIFIDDDMLRAKPFGDVSDPMLAKALETITGVAPISRKSVLKAPSVSLNYQLLRDPVREYKSKAFADIRIHELLR